MADLKTKKSIAVLIDDKSYLELDGEVGKHYADSDILYYRTRRNGSVGDEKFGAEDLMAAEQIKEKILEKFKANIDCISIKTVDEWVHMQVQLT